MVALVKILLLISGIAFVLLVLFTLNVLDVTNIVKTYEIIKRLDDDKSFPILSGYRGATFDGEFVYYSPYYSNYGRHAEMIRYDISRDFKDPNAWEHIKIPPKIVWIDNGEEIIVNTSGFQGILYDEPFVYYVPYHVDNKKGSVVLRYDTQMEFNNPDAFQHTGLFDVYEDGVVHKNFMYLSPHLDFNNERNTVPLRYDSSKPFFDPNAWEQHDVKQNTSYIDAEVVMDKIFYAPWQTTNSTSSQIMIYDTNGSFKNDSSWEFIDIPYKGYSGAAFNGKYIVFSPGWCSIYDCNDNDSNFLFLEPTSLEISYVHIPNASYNGIIDTGSILYPVPYYLKDNPIFLKIDGSEIEFFTPSIAKSAYWGGVFDGEFVYYSPYQFINSDKRSNEFLRYDTSKDFSDELAWETISLHVIDFER